MLHADTSVSPHNIFGGTLSIFKNNFVNELDYCLLKFTAIKMFFKSSEELGKRQQKILVDKLMN